MRDVANNTDFSLPGVDLKRHETILSGFALVICLTTCGLLPSAYGTPPIVDDRWSVTVNGQTVRVDPGGSFRLPNISAADMFGATGPGSQPDFNSDEWFQAVGTAAIDGVTWYAYSEPFQIISQQTYHVATLSVSRRPPADIPESIAIEVVTTLQDDTLYVGGVGGPGSTLVKVRANFAGVDNSHEVTAGDGTTYRTSNRRVVDVVESGSQVNVTAIGIGTAFVTATNRGATAVQRFVVTTPCVDTLLLGRVVDSGGAAIPGAIVSTEGYSNSPTGTNTNGDFSFNVCYTPGTSFSVVVVGPTPPTPREKAVLTDITPVPDGVTDVGTITLDGNFVFWNVKSSGNWDTAGNWHTNSVPASTSHVFINIEDRLSPTFNPYTVTLNTNATIADFTLDSAHATFRSLSPDLTVTGASRVVAGKVAWKNAVWFGPSLTNSGSMEFSGLSSLGLYPSSGMQVTNNGMVTVLFDGTFEELRVDGSSSFVQASPLHDLQINGGMHVDRGATITTTASCKGIVLNGLLKVGRQFPLATFNHNGGSLAVNNLSVIGDNDGLIIDANGILNVNAGEMVISPTASVEVIGGPGGIVNLNGGVVNNDGLFWIRNGAILNYNGGTILGLGNEGYGIIVDGLVKLGSEAIVATTFALRRPSASIQGVISAGQTVFVQGKGNGGNATTTAIPDGNGQFINNGELILDSIASTSSHPSAELIVGSNGGLINNGTVSIIPGTGGARELDMLLMENFGTLTVDAPTSLTRSSSTYRNSGTLTIESGGSLVTEGSGIVFEQLAGTISVADDVAFALGDGSAFGLVPRFSFVGGEISAGTVAVLNGYVSIGAAANARGHFTIWGGCTLDGEIGPNHTVIIEGSTRGFGAARLITPSFATLTNRGTLRVDTPDVTSDPTAIFLSAGQQLINELSAMFEVTAGSGQNPLMRAALRNKGTTNIRRSVTLGNNDDTHQNQTTGIFNVSNNAVVTFQGNASIPFTNAADAQSTGVVGGIGQLNVGSGRTFQNGGRVEPGGDAGVGTLSVAGNYTQTSGGTLRIELGGTSAGQYDKLALTQQATLAGTLSVALLPGYSPAVNDTFEVMTFGSSSGDFNTGNLIPIGSGLALSRSYTPVTMTLTVVAASLRDSAMETNGHPSTRQ